MHRRVVNAFLGLGFVSTLSGFAGAALAYLWPGASSASGSNLLMGKGGPLSASSLGEDEGVVGRSHLGKVLVIRRGERLVGLQATCTHLGCTVAWNSASQQVECPCHGARYDLQGQVLRGPAREPLARLEVSAADEGIRVGPPLRG
jgi:cytochrome b6-f complex iron-sulfur subunit